MNIPKQIVIYLLLSLVIGFVNAQEIIKFEQNLIYKDKTTMIRPISMIVGNNYSYLNVEIKTKVNHGRNFRLVGYNQDKEKVCTRYCLNWDWGFANLSRQWMPTDYYKTYDRTGKNKISFLFSGPLFNNVKFISIINTDISETLFEMIPVELVDVPAEPMHISFNQVKEIVDSINNPLCGIFTIDGRNIACCRYQNKYEFFDIDDCGIWYKGEKCGECYTSLGGKAYKGYWKDHDNKTLYKDALFLLDNDVLTVWRRYDNYGRGAEYIFGEERRQIQTLYRIYPTQGIETTNQQESNSSNELQSSGSGVLISDNIVITNNHVVAGANKIEVVLNINGISESFKARVLCTDKTNDLAIVCIKDDKFKSLGSAPFTILPNVADVGTSVFAMGYPMSQYLGEEVKVTDGIISSKSGFDGDIATYQITAPIQPGNSGGPLFDKQGNLVGITSSGIDKSVADNIGYAIKSSYVLSLIDSAPINIKLPQNENSMNVDLPTLIKLLKPYIAYIKIY